MRDKLGAPAAGSAYYAPQTYYSGSACAAAAASEPSFLLPAAMLSPMYQTGSAPGFHPLYQVKALSDKLLCTLSRQHHLCIVPLRSNSTVI